MTPIPVEGLRKHSEIMKKELWISVLCGVMMLAGTACSHSDEPGGQEEKIVKRRHLTINAQQGTASPRRILKATITDEGSTLSSSWTEGDILSYCNLQRYKSWEQDPIHYEDIYILYKGELTAIESKPISTLVGDVECTKDDHLAVVYPKNNTFEYISAGTQYSYTFPFTGQDGTLERVATHYHQVYGRAHVTAVTDMDASATMPRMKSLLTICKFSFKEKETNAAIPVKTLTISYNDATSENNKYPQEGKVTVTVNTANQDAHAERYNVTDPLLIDCGASELDEVYVALMPEIASRTYNFSVTNSNGTYTGTASAWLKEGEYVPATGLKLVKE